MPVQTERRHLPYTPPQLFDLVADVGRYPDFVPWIIAVRVSHRTDRSIHAEMTAGTRFLQRRFSSVAKLDRPHRIAISSHDPMFERFEQKWTFAPALAGGTDVEYHVDLKFRSLLLQTAIDASFPYRAGTIISAFYYRARHLYGAAS